jgi:hypothetical protein
MTHGRPENYDKFARPLSSILNCMSTALSPIESQFATEEEAQAHDRWFRAKVEEALADPRPLVPHDAVLADINRVSRFRISH